MNPAPDTLSLYLLYFFPMVFAPLVSLTIAAYAWQRRDVRGSAVFAVMMADIALWSLITVFLELSRTPEDALIWYKLRYLSIASVPILMLIFVIEYSGRIRRLSPSLILLLFVVPICTQVIIWTVPDLFIREVTFHMIGPLMMIQNDVNGPWFWVHFFYSVFVVLSGLLLILFARLHSAEIYRWQCLTLLLGGIPPFIISAIMATFFDRSIALLTPLVFLAMGLVYTWGLFRYRLMGLNSIAPALLIENMREGVLVLDSTGQIVDINPSGSRILDQPANKIIGSPIQNILPPAFPPAGLLSDTRVNEIPLTIAGVKHWFSIKSNPIQTRHLKNRGNLLLIEDITEQKLSQEVLQELNEALESKVAQRTLTLEQRARQMELISGVSSALRQVVTRSDMLSTLVRQMVQVVNADGGVALLRHEQGFSAEAVDGLLASGEVLEVLFPPELFWKVLQEEQPEIMDLSAGGHPSGPFSTLVVVPLRSSHERLGVLAAAFLKPTQLSLADLQLLTAIAEMAGNALNRINLHNILEQMVQDSTRRLNILYEITAIANEYQQLNQILELILKLTLDAVKSPAGFIHLLDEDEQHLRLAACQNINPERLSSSTAGPGERPFWEQVFSSGQLLFSNTGTKNSSLPSTGYPGSSDDWIGLPVAKKSHILGTLCISTRNFQSQFDEDTALLISIAGQIGIAVESARLRVQAEQTAVMLERQRLARELHDSVAQSLYGSILIAKSGLNAFVSDRIPEAQHSLSRVVEISQQALKEMRLLIYELRPLDLQELGLQEAIHQRLQTVESRAEIQTEFIYDGNIEIPTEMSLGLYRIVQEALNNILKHSRATRVQVSLTANPETIRLVVEDNGVGFDFRVDGQTGGLGIPGMRERAEGLNGKIKIETSQGAGTRLVVECPAPRDAAFSSV